MIRTTQLCQKKKQRKRTCPFNRNLGDAVISAETTLRKLRHSDHLGRRAIRSRSHSLVSCVATRPWRSLIGKTRQNIIHYSHVARWQNAKGLLVSDEMRALPGAGMRSSHTGPSPLERFV